LIIFFSSQVRLKHTRLAAASASLKILAGLRSAFTARELFFSSFCWRSTFVVLLVIIFCTLSASVTRLPPQSPSVSNMFNSQDYVTQNNKSTNKIC